MHIFPRLVHAAVGLGSNSIGLGRPILFEGFHGVIAAENGEMDAITIDS